MDTTLYQTQGACHKEDGIKLEDLDVGAMGSDFSIVAHEVTVIADEFNEDSLPTLEDKIFPAETKIIYHKYSSNNDYTASLRLKCYSKEDFKIWLAEFERLSCSNYRVAKTVPRAGKTVVYKATYRCQHNTYPASHRGRVKAPSKKHTGCRAKIKVAIKSSVKGRRVRSKDYLRADYPTVVEILFQHNHNVGTVDVLKYRNPTEEVRKKFIELFKRQHAPEEALNIHKMDLLEENRRDFYKIIADRSMCPDMPWVYRLYYSVIKKPKNTTKTNNCNSEGASYDPNITDEHERQIKLQPHTNEKEIKWEDYEKRWREVTSILNEKFVKNPSDTAHAMDSMILKFTGIETDSFLMSAMHNFGNFQYKKIEDDRNATDILV